MKIDEASDSRETNGLIRKSRGRELNGMIFYEILLILAFDYKILFIIILIIKIKIRYEGITLSF